MTSKQNNNQQEKQMTKGIKDKAGAAFHSVHKALEKTEFAAMNTVDKTANTVSGITGNSKSKNSNTSANKEK